MLFHLTQATHSNSIRPTDILRLADEFNLPDKLNYNIRSYLDNRRIIVEGNEAMK